MERASLKAQHEGLVARPGARRRPLRPLDRPSLAAIRGIGTSAIAVRELGLDLMMLIAAGLAAAVSAPAADLPEPNLAWLTAFSAFTIALLAYNGVYRNRFALHYLDDVRSIIAATAVAAMSVTFLRVFVTDDSAAAAEAVRAWLFAAVYLAAGRAGVQLVRNRLRRNGLEAENTLILGAGRVGQMVARRLAERQEFGLRPVAFLDHDPLDTRGIPMPVIGRGVNDARDPDAFANHLESAVRDFSIRHVIVTFSLTSHEVELALVRRCEELGIGVSLVPRLFEGIPDQTELERIGGLPLISVYPTDPKGWQFAAKYLLDRAAAVGGLILAAPLMAVAAIGTLLTLGRPLLFRQTRIGMDGREFEMLKFRTMREPSPDPAAGNGHRPESSNRTHAAGNGRLASSGHPGSNGHPGSVEMTIGPGGVEGDDRRTRFGAFLRRTSIDELPQLINVVRGDMSLIGPRPERPDFATAFNRSVYRYADRHRVKSGITGWAQVHGLRGKTSLADRAEWDNYYIENWSLWLDLKIVFLTMGAIFTQRPE
jgi:exopolysaccharide biosynthesis polyprenyl glycosylphosphotransferase